MKIKIPNYLTIGRIIIVPVFVFAYYLPGFYGDVIPFVLFVLASFTDFLDGLLARMYKEESKLGELLDPIADKIIVATPLILLESIFIKIPIIHQRGRQIIKLITPITKSINRFNFCE